jgi:hypothetical protein
MARILGLQKLLGGPSRNRTVDLSCERLVATASACEVQLFLRIGSSEKVRITTVVPSGRRQVDGSDR